MNKNILIRRIKRDIGIYGIALPIENVDQYIMEILEDTTVPVFSNYCPTVETVQIDIHDLEKQPRIASACDLYVIPDSLLVGRELLYVLDVKYDESYLRESYHPTYFGGDEGLGLLGDMMIGNVSKNITDTIINSITFKYEFPRKLYIFDSLMSSKIMLELGFQHDKNLQSISPTQAESFFKLALLDVKAGLYNTIKHYDGLETAYGRIELKIDDWQSAPSDRKDLLAEWDETYLLDLVGVDYR